MKNITVKIISPRSHENINELNEAYRCWCENWNWTIKNDFKNNASLYSNEFLEQDYIVALFDNEHCFGVGLLRTLDLRFNGVHADIWLGQWTKSAIKKVSQNNNKVVICSYNIIEPEYRKENENNLKAFDLLTYAMSRQSVNMGHDAVLGMSRNTRKVNRQGYTFGATAIEQGVMNKKIKEPTDLLLFKRSSLIEVIEKLEGTIFEKIWNESLEEKESVRTLKIAA